uniref:Survival Motor Neuron Gemin2-binding domain-containing protein n=1 Tax=Mycena chlorophos TaxID=658473 RepID=A0ABQ0LJG6_MYCCL|nr:predicted protein [Mycena chlorophos]
MQRPVISYEDITLPYDDPPSSTSPAQSSRKRKWNAQKPPAVIATVKAEDGELGDDDEEEQDSDSRMLTAEEIWDDSALIDAWNAATEEYEALNGPGKGWKDEPVHKSPWYNVPPNNPPPKKKRKTVPMPTVGPTVEAEQVEEADSRPIDFASFVPAYDASLALPEPQAPDGVSTGAFALPVPGPSMPGQDEAFQRALGAMYWGGYWTAVYHCQRSGAAQKEAAEQQDEEMKRGLVLGSILYSSSFPSALPPVASPRERVRTYLLYTVSLRS